MSGSFEDYGSEIAAGFQEGVGDVTRSAIAGIGDAYQQFLMADATIGPAQPLTGTMETTSYTMEAEPVPTTPELNPMPEPEPPAHDIEPEL
jgi:hypothetical protein